MLNLWKKIQEKGQINTSPKRKETIVTNLDPRYDGPLRGFEPNVDDSVPLEKCYLSPALDDILRDNKMGYNYFKKFLETRTTAAEVLDLWCLMSTSRDRRHMEWKTAAASNNSFDEANSPERRDDLEIYTNSAAYIADKVSKFPDDIRGKITLTMANKSNVDGWPHMDANELNATLNEILRDCWNEFLRSEWYCRYQVDLLTSRSVSLGDVLRHDSALSYFIQFLEVEGCQHTVEFWFAATSHEKFVRNSLDSGNYGDAEKNHALNEAINIYEKYLSLQATCPLGFDDRVRCRVEEAICDEQNGPHFDCFQPAVVVVLAFLRRHYLIPFFSSQHYVHLLSDMIRSSSSNGCAAVTVMIPTTAAVTNANSGANHSPTSSISECSVQSKRPLLNDKLDPDSMWRRRKQRWLRSIGVPGDRMMSVSQRKNGLSFGRIDQFGRFRRDIEPDPGRNNESKISKMMKKWVHRNENKVEEEMAWQVAEMVVKDVIDLTMGCSNETYTIDEDCVINKNYAR